MSPLSHRTRRSFVQHVMACGAGLLACRSLLHAEISSSSPAPMDRVKRTAREELDLALAGRERPAKIVLEVLANSPDAQRLAAENIISLHRVPADDDAYEAVLQGDTLYLIGTTPRGLLHAVFALHEALQAGETLTPGWRKQGHFRFRQRIFHPRFQPWPGERADVRYLAHLGATHALLCHDWNGSCRSLQGYVTSPVFPHAVDAAEVARNHAALRRIIDHCADHGLGAMLWLTELPCQGGPWVPAADREKFLGRFPAGVLSPSGTYEGQVLCFGHPQAQEFYRDLLRRFFADFPEVETLFVFGQDSSGEFCDPAACSRCRGMSRIAQRDRLLRFLIDEGSRVRPGLRVLTTSWGWEDDAEEFVQRQAALPAASGVYMAARKDGWQCERQSHGFLRAVRDVCRKQHQLFIGYDDFHWGDDSVHGMGDIQDFPLGIAAKLRRWHALGADGVFDHWGCGSEDVWSNSVACRNFFLDPEGDVREQCRAIAVRQFGAAAGSAALAAWDALESAHIALSPACHWAPEQWPMWYAGRAGGPVPADDALEALRRVRLPDREHPSRSMAEALDQVARAWRTAWPHYTRAAGHLTEAAALADSAPVFYAFWWNGAAKVPGRREHLLRQKRYVESVAAAGREIGLQFELYALWEKCGRYLARYRAAASPLLRELADACRDAARYFAAVGQPVKWPVEYETKAKRIEEFLRSA